MTTTHITRSSFTLALSAGAAAAVLAITACSSSSEPSAQNDVTTSPEKLAETYAAMSADIMTTRGKEVQGTPLNTEADVDRVYKPLVCDKDRGGLVQQWKELKDWEGVGKVTTTVEDLQTDGDRAQFRMVMHADNRKPLQGVIHMNKTPDGNWQICAPNQ